MNLTLTATARGPVFIGADPEAGNVAAGLDHVPGSVVRGALAAWWIRRNGTPDAVRAELRNEFRGLFDGDVRYGAMRPVGSCLAPLSVNVCKYRGEPACATTAVDLLHTDTDTEVVACPACGGALVAARGETVGGPGLVDRTMTALTSAGTAQENALFTRVGFPAHTVDEGPGALRPTTFEGVVVDPQERWQGVTNWDGIWFGAKRSVAGRVDLTAATSPPPEVAPRADGLLALVADSPVVAVDDAGRPVLAWPLDEIGAVLGVSLGPSDIVREWRRPARVGGWNAAAGMPKPTEHVLAAGSALLVRLPAAVEGAALTTLAQRGLGLRRPEGFGFVAVNPPEWTVPVAAGERSARGPGERGSKPGSDEARALLAVVGTGPDLRLCVEIVRDALLARETDDPAPTHEMLDRARVDRWSVDARAALRGCLSVRDTDALRRAVEILAAAAQETDP